MALETGSFISDLNAANPTASDPKSGGDDHLRLLKSTIKNTFPNITGAVLPTHTELNHVDGVTSPIQGQLDTLTAEKAPKASPAFTGTPTAPTAATGTNTTQLATTAFVDADFAKKASPAFTGTPTAPTAATGTSTTQLATTQFVANTAFSSALPAQLGNAGEFLTTDGTNAAWASQYPDQTANAGKFLTTDGTNANWGTVPPAGLNLIATASAANVASVLFTSGIDSTYDEYLIELINIVPASAGAILFLALSTNGGSTFTANHSTKGVGYDGTTLAGYNGGSAGIQLTSTGTLATASRGGASASVRLFAPSSTASNKHLVGFSHFVNSAASVNVSVTFAGEFTSTAAVNALRVSFSTGNVLSGLIKLYGIKKAV